jgi:DNA polymerase
MELSGQESSLSHYLVAPGREEDLAGRPFVGRAGKLLDQMLAAIKLTRAELYITNVVKCRPPGNRTPEPDEIEACRPYLTKQVRVIKPKIICTLGLTAAKAVLSTNASLSSLRGRVHQIEDIKVVVTFHPAYLLRYPAYKREAWEDLKLLKRLYDEVCRK